MVREDLPTRLTQSPLRIPHREKLCSISPTLLSAATATATVEKSQRVRSEYVQQLRDVRDMQQQHVDHLHALLQAKRAEIEAMGLHHLIDDESAVIPRGYAPARKAGQQAAGSSKKTSRKAKKAQRKKRRGDDAEDDDGNDDDDEDGGDDGNGDDDDDDDDEFHFGGNSRRTRAKRNKQEDDDDNEQERRQIAEQMLRIHEDLHNVDPFDVSFFRTIKGFQGLENNLEAVSNAYSKLNEKEKATLSHILQCAAHPARDGGKKIDECKCADCPYRKLLGRNFAPAPG